MSAKPALHLVTAEAAVPVAKPGEIVIRGTTRQGERFRPSDWAERLYYAVASYGPYRKITFNPLVTLRFEAGVKCIAIDPKLREIDSMTFDFLLSFATSNDLETSGC